MGVVGGRTCPFEAPSIRLGCRGSRTFGRFCIAVWLTSGASGSAVVLAAAKLSPGELHHLRGHVAVTAISSSGISTTSNSRVQALLLCAPCNRARSPRPLLLPYYLSISLIIIGTYMIPYPNQRPYGIRMALRATPNQSARALSPL